MTAAAIADTVRALGHAVERVSKATEALAELDRSDFDLIVLDIFLPDVRGDRLIPRVRRIKPEIAIVTMTGYNSRELERKIRKLGILYYIIKPVCTKDLSDLFKHVSHRMNKTP